MNAANIESRELAAAVRLADRTGQLLTITPSVEQALNHACEEAGLVRTDDVPTRLHDAMQVACDREGGSDITALVRAGHDLRSDLQRSIEKEARGW